MQAFADQANPPPMKTLRVLVACEVSGIVRDAFLEKGHDAWSCDLLPAEHNSNRHIQGDVRDLLNDGWDFLIVAHPPCFSGHTLILTKEVPFRGGRPDMVARAPPAAN